MYLIFDLDGTLVDSLPGITEALNRALAEHGLPPHPQSAVRGFIGDGTLELTRRALVDRPLPDLDPEVATRRVNASFHDHYLACWPGGTVPYPGIAEALRTLADDGAKLAVLSNKPHSFTVEIVARLFPGGKFCQVLGQTPDFPRKPAPDAATHLVETWKIEPADACFIGDSVVDRETARAAGIPFVGVSWGYHTRHQLGPQPVADVASLLERLQRGASASVELSPEGPARRKMAGGRAGEQEAGKAAKPDGSRHPRCFAHAAGASFQQRMPVRSRVEEHQAPISEVGGMFRTRPRTRAEWRQIMPRFFRQIVVAFARFLGQSPR